MKSLLANLGKELLTNGRFGNLQNFKISTQIQRKNSIGSIPKSLKITTLKSITKIKSPSIGKPALQGSLSC